MTLSEFFLRLKNDTTSATMPTEYQVSIPHALIIDQFEELFSAYHEAWEKREGFFQQLSLAMQDDPYLWVVLVMREDFIAALDPHAHLVPSRFRRRYYMQQLERDAALKAIKKPVEKTRPFAEGVAEKLVDDLSGIKIQKPDGTTYIQPGQFIEPVQLQVVCYNLWENLPFEGTQITEKDLQDVGDINRSLERHYARRVKEVAESKGVNERAIREWFGKKLITADGMRTMVLQQMHKRDGELDDDVIQALQSDLVRAEKRGGATFYELTHDRLVEPIVANNRKWEEEHSSLLHQQAVLWVSQGRDDSWLLSDQALTEVDQWAINNPGELTEIDKEFLDACRRQRAKLKERQEFHRRELEAANKLADERARSVRMLRRFSVIAIVLMFIAIIASFFANSQRNAAVEQKKIMQSMHKTQLKLQAHRLSK